MTSESQYCPVLCCVLWYGAVLSGTGIDSPVLLCPAVPCTALHCTVLLYTVIRCPVLCCTELYCTALGCTCIVVSTAVHQRMYSIYIQLQFLCAMTG